MTQPATTSQPAAPNDDLKSANGRRMRSNTAKSLVVQMAALATSTVDRIFLTALLIRMWGTDGFSDWTTIVSATAAVVIIECGFQHFVGNQLLKAQLRDRRLAFNRLLGWAVFSSLVLGALVTTMVALAATLFDVQAWLGIHSPQFIPAMVILGAWNALKIARGPVLQIYRGMGEYHNYIWADVRATVASIGLATIAVLLGAGVIAVALIFLITTFFVSILWSLCDIRRRFPTVTARPVRPGWGPVRRGIIALRWYALYFISTTLVQTAPILTIAALGMSGHMLATFAVQRTLVNFVRTLSVSLTTAVGAELSIMSLGGEERGLRQGIYLVARINACLAAFAVAGLLYFGKELVGLWTGNPDLGSARILILLMVPTIVLAPALAFQMTAVLSDRLKDQSIAAALTATIAIGGGIVLGDHFGISGIAGALALGETLAFGILSPLMAARTFKIRYFGVVTHSFVAFAVITAWAIIIAAILMTVPFPSGSAGLVARVAVWFAIAFPPAAWLCASPTMREAARTKLGFTRRLAVQRSDATPK